MDLSLSPKLLELQEKTRSFIKDQIIPFENDPRQSEHGPSDELRKELIELARKAGLLTPHASVEMGGLGLTHIEKAIVFEESGYSSLGPIAMNIHAPDEGNIHLLEEIASPEQRERWLRPLVTGKARSCFAMTEPSPGAGSDPSLGHHGVRAHRRQRLPRSGHLPPRPQGAPWPAWKCCLSPSRPSHPGTLTDRLPLAACRLPLAACRLPLAACRLPRSRKIS